MFAQTLAYGLFSARVMSSSTRQFTLAEAAKLIPRTNPFLRDFFELITGPKLDDEPFVGFVQDLVTVLECADMALILEDFGKGVESGRRRDPVVHFYETFLSAYDPKLREMRGVYYTPEPVVSYIVESIDWLLRDKFGLKDGLADKTKFTFKHKVGDEESRKNRIVFSSLIQPPAPARFSLKSSRKSANASRRSIRPDSGPLMSTNICSRDSSASSCSWRRMPWRISRSASN